MRRSSRTSITPDRRWRDGPPHTIRSALTQRSGISPPQNSREPSPQRAIGSATPTSCADHPLLRRRPCAKLNPRLWPQLDECRGSQQRPRGNFFPARSHLTLGRLSKRSRVSQNRAALHVVAFTVLADFVVLTAFFKALGIIQVLQLNVAQIGTRCGDKKTDALTYSILSDVIVLPPVEEEIRRVIRNERAKDAAHLSGALLGHRARRNTIG